MRFHKFLAFSTAVVTSTLIGACAIPQPAFECNTLPPFFAFYTLEEGDPSTECGNYGGDYLVTQRYLPPNGKEARLAILPYNVGIWSSEREDPSDPKKAKESAIGRFETLLPNESGVCTVLDISTGEQNFPALIDEDSGDEIYPPLLTRHQWSEFRVLSTAEFPGSLVEGTVTITENACTAKYKVYGVHPVHPCRLSENTMRDGKPYNQDCDPEADPAAGRVTGSGMNAAIEPTCITVTGVNPAAEAATGVTFDEYGICGPSAAKTFAVLAAEQQR